MPFKCATVLGTMFFAVSASMAQAQQCPTASTQPLSVSSFDAVQSLTSRFPTAKDEFETTADFTARQRAATSQIPRAAWISLPIDLNHVTYNADAGAFEITSLAVDNRNLNFGSIFSDAGVGIATARRNNIDLVFPSEVLSRDSYVGQNVYGAKRAVTRLSTITRAIFDRPARSNESLFPRLRDAPAFNIPVPADQAQTYRERLRAAVLLAPREPYYVEGADQTRVTMTGGRDEAVIYQIIIADIRCIAITDDHDVVLQSRATN